MSEAMKRIRLRYPGTCVVCGTSLAKGDWAIHDPEARTVRCESHGDNEDAKSDRAQDDGQLPKLIQVSRAGSCTACDAELPVGAQAFWVKQTRVLVCPACTAGEVAAGLGTAGASAGRVADGAARRHAERLLSAYPMLGEHLVENAQPTSFMQRWDRGADGERVVGRALDRRVAAGDIVVLHDRTVPGRGGNIDHIAVGPRRITVIDAKHYRGHKIRTPKRRGERTLEINGEPAETLLDGILAQRRHIEVAVGSELAGCVEATLAFVGADLGWIGQWSCRGVWCLDPKEAVERAAVSTVLRKWPYDFDAARRKEIAEALARAFPPA